MHSSSDSHRTAETRTPTQRRGARRVLPEAPSEENQPLPSPARQASSDYQDLARHRDTNSTASERQRRPGADSGARPGPTGDSGGRSVSARGPAARASSPAPEGRARSRPAGSDPGRRWRPLGRGPRRRQAPARPHATHRRRRRRPRLTCGLSSSVSSMGSLSIPGIVAKAGRRQDTRRPPTAPRAAPPAAADPARPLAATAAPSQELRGFRAGNPAPQARQSRLPYAHWLTATPVNAAGLTGEIPSRPPAQPAVAASVHLLLCFESVGH